MFQSSSLPHFFYPILSFFIRNLPFPASVKYRFYNAFNSANSILPLNQNANANNSMKFNVCIPIGIAALFIFALFSLIFLFSSSDPNSSVVDSREISIEFDPIRSAAVREAFIHAFSGYSNAGWGSDELKPVTNSSKNNWGNFGISIVDALDTIIIMELKEEFDRAKLFVSTLNFDRDYVASVFETTIRYLGGLLGAFELSRDQVFLTKATELGELLMFAFESPIPKSKLNLHTHQSSNFAWTAGASILSEIGSIQLELAYLSHHTGRPEFATKSRKIFDDLRSAEKSIPGLYPVYIDAKQWKFTNSLISWGSMGDSMYEYTLKLYLLSGRTDVEALAMYSESVDAMLRHMAAIATVHFEDGSPSEEFGFLPQFSSGSADREMEHLTCFVPGLLALGAISVNEKALKREPNAVEAALIASLGIHLRFARALLNTCTAGYTSMASGLGPESLFFSKISQYLISDQLSHGVQLDSIKPIEIKLKSRQHLLTDFFSVGQSAFKLRPETIESVFYFHRLTGENYYRELGWKMFEAINQNCRTPFGFASQKDVRIRSFGSAISSTDSVVAGGDSMDSMNSEFISNHLDSQESFFLAETLKYFYLLFDDKNTISLEKYVFNTEAHPLGVFHINENENAAAIGEENNQNQNQDQVEQPMNQINPNDEENQEIRSE